MALESWIDKIAELMAVSDGRNGTVLSYRCYDKAQMPEALSQFPCAITYVTGARLATGMSTGGPLKMLYRGVTEFHLTANTDKSQLPYCMLFFGRIRNAVASHLQLSGLVDDFRLQSDNSIVGPATLQYGAEDPHFGLVVNWEVKADETSDTGYSPAI